MALPNLPLPALVSALLCHLQEVRGNSTQVLNGKLLEQFDSQSSSMWRLPSRPRKAAAAWDSEYVYANN